MIQYMVVPATEEHADALATTMSPADVQEVHALGMTPREALRVSMAVSRDPKAFLANKEVVAMFGVGEANRGQWWRSTKFIPWFLSANTLKRHQVHFLRGCRPLVGEWLADHGHLTGYVDARHTVAIRWIRWMGFEVHPAKPYGHFGMDFHKFERKA